MACANHQVKNKTDSVALDQTGLERHLAAAVPVSPAQLAMWTGENLGNLALIWC